ncbi:hypothetical protein DPX16_15543 [Anabarilius grahami]|uniref:Uncharacterized protein n=1 Tax=Anabarilius grahami TaxID=495550 RepID=A0A3N0YIN1_ANAGA|nr:hypothetical protein DPX16_15543 [Anabarilius grahami]
MVFGSMFTLVARNNPDFCSFTKEFISVALACPYDDETLKSLFWIGANYHRPVDLPDTSGLSWMEHILRCLESVRPRSRAQPDPEPVSSPRTAEHTCEPPADGELPPAAKGQPDSETPRTEVTCAQEVELQLTSDQGCEPTTSADEGESTTEREDWLIDFGDESTPTQTHPSCLPSSSNRDITMDCVLFTDSLSTLSTPRSASPPTTSLLDVICPAPSPGNPCDVERQVTLPPAACWPEVPVASPPAAVLVAPSRPVDLPAPSRLRPSTVPPETLRLTAPPVSLVRPAPPWSVVPPPPQRTYETSSTFSPSTPSATEGSSFPSETPLSSVEPTSPQPSGSPAPPPPIVASTSPRPPRPATSRKFASSPTAPRNPPAESPPVVLQMPSVRPKASGLRPSSTRPWTVGSGELWVCASSLPPTPPGDRRPPFTPSPSLRPPPEPPPATPMMFFHGARTRLAGGGS